MQGSLGVQPCTVGCRISVVEAHYPERAAAPPLMFIASGPSCRSHHLQHGQLPQHCPAAALRLRGGVLQLNSLSTARFRCASSADSAPALPAIPHHSFSTQHLQALAHLIVPTIASCVSLPASQKHMQRVYTEVLNARAAATIISASGCACERGRNPREIASC